MDFSTNANACGPCPAALEAVRAADVTRYPDPAYAALRAQLAAFHGVAPGRVLLAGSASEFIFRVTAWAARRVASVRVPRHAYGDYAAAAAAHRLPVLPRDAAPQLAWVCEPSSPLGQADAAAAADHDILVLDLAYAPLRLHGAPTPRGAAAWQLWSPNKALGLTGVRGAYAIAPASLPPSELAQIDALAPSWVLGATGVAMLQAWCAPEVQHWLEQSRATLRAWKQRQLEVLATLGWRVLPSDANFMACALPSAGDMHRLPGLRQRGIQLRDCASFGLPGHVRVSVQPPAAQDALAQAWRATPPTASTPE